MKVINIEHAIRQAAKLNRDRQKRQIVVPAGTDHNRPNWPSCLTCGRGVDSCKLENVNAKGCEIRVICYHGTDSPKEDAIKVVWDVPRHDALDTDILEDKNVGWAIKRAMRDYCAFDPTHIIGVG